MITRSVMRYHGGKFHLARWIINHMPTHRTYTEAFCGAASVFFQKPRCYAEVLGDKDGEIINVFRVLRNAVQARELARALRLTPYSREEFELSYLADGDPIEQARRTIFRSFAGHGSSAIARKTGFRNYSGTQRSATPAQDWGNFPDAIESFVERLRGVYIESLPAAEVLKRYDAPHALHYVDPPYVHATRSAITKEYHAGYRHEMTDVEHEELAAQLHGLKGMVLLSGYHSPLYDALYGDWMRVEKAALAEGHLARTEVLWLNPAAAGSQQLRMDTEVAS